MHAASSKDKAKNSYKKKRKAVSQQSQQSI